jgi:hypothetical protein
MRDISRRLNKAEKALNLNEKPKTVTIVQYAGELPPDRTDGNITTHFVMYDEKGQGNEKQPKTTNIRKVEAAR